MSKFMVYNWFHIRCETCHKVTEIKPGLHEMIISDCKCNEEVKEEAKPKKKVVNEK